MQEAICYGTIIIALIIIFSIVHETRHYVKEIHKMLKDKEG